MHSFGIGCAFVIASQSQLMYHDNETDSQPIRPLIFMIICSCNRLTESEIAKHCTEDMQSCEQLYASMGCKMNCGSCADYVESVLLKPEAAMPPVGTCGAELKL